MPISIQTHKKLWGLAASRCAFPNCRQELIISNICTNDPVVIGEEAHIVASSESGPRGTSELTDKERDSYENLILLCSSHHTLVDKNREEYYSVARLQQMKTEHERWVRENLRGISPI